MTDLDQLEALAKAVIPAVADGYDWNSGILSWSHYRDATSPAAILALIAEVRALREDAERWKTYIRLFSAESSLETAVMLVMAIDEYRAKEKA